MIQLKPKCKYQHLQESPRQQGTRALFKIITLIIMTPLQLILNIWYRHLLVQRRWQMTWMSMSWSCWNVVVHTLVGEAWRLCTHHIYCVRPFSERLTVENELVEM
jgi:predicted membrane protein